VSRDDAHGYGYDWHRNDDRHRHYYRHDEPAADDGPADNGPADNGPADESAAASLSEQARAIMIRDATSN
jgi:hypothetical protein